MHKVRTILLLGENMAKLPTGPTRSRPGPTLDKVAMTEVTEVSKLKPSSETNPRACNE